MLSTSLIQVLGLTLDEISIVKKNVPKKDCKIMVTDEYRDLIAISAMAVIIRSDAVDKEDVDILIDWYKEIAPFSESVAFIGKVQLPKELTRHIVVYESFDVFADKIKYFLLSACRKQKKTENFSATLANAIMILSLIRKQPYITSAELSEKLELSQRSVQRYIETLRVTGEWIEYSSEKKGWMLSAGKSVLWGDFD